jgi:hypothetical protein
VDRPALPLREPPAEKFAEAVWGQRAHLSPARRCPRASTTCSRGPTSIAWSPAGLRTPFLRVAKDGRDAAREPVHPSGGVGASIGDQVGDDRLTRLFADGATIVLQGCAAPGLR